MEDKKIEAEQDELKAIAEKLRQPVIDRKKNLLSNSPIAEVVKAAGYSVVDCPGKDVTRLPLLAWNDEAGERYVIVRAIDFRH